MASYQTPEFAQSSTRQNDWIDYRRDDGELLGWICPHDDDFIAIDRLGRLTTGVVDWLEAEEALEAIGLGYLADTLIWISRTTSRCASRSLKWAPTGLP